MKHARDDYDRIQDPMAIIPHDEPVFLIRGQDRCAPDTVRFWAERAERLGAAPDIVNAAIRQADAMENWLAHRVSKIPDLKD